MAKAVLVLTRAIDVTVKRVLMFIDWCDVVRLVCLQCTHCRLFSASIRWPRFNLCVILVIGRKLSIHCSCVCNRYPFVWVASNVINEQARCTGQCRHQFVCCIDTLLVMGEWWWQQFKFKNRRVFHALCEWNQDRKHVQVKRVAVDDTVYKELLKRHPAGFGYPVSFVTTRHISTE